MKLKDAKLTITNYGITAAVCYDHNDVSLEQWYDAFRGCLVGVGFTEEQLENFVLEIAESISDARDRHCPPFEGEIKGINGINEDALSESFLKAIKQRDSILMKQEERDVDLMIESSNKKSDDFIVKIQSNHLDYWEIEELEYWNGLTTFFAGNYALNNDGKWYSLFGGNHVYPEMPIEEFEQKYYSPWKQSQQPSLDVSNV